jgi:hypothetical protein
VVLKKEPCSKRVVVEVEELLLGMHVAGKEGALGVELSYEHNVG